MIGTFFHRVFSNRSEIFSELLLAAEDGHFRKVKCLLPLVDPDVLGHRPLMFACMRGHTKCVELLLPLATTEDRRTVAKHIAEHGPTSTLKLLVDYDPEFAPILLVQAVAGKNCNTTTILCGLTDPKHQDSLALQWAVITGQKDMAQLLLDVSDPQAALLSIQKQHPDESHRWEWFEDLIAHTQKQKILSEIGQPQNEEPSQRSKRKM